MVAAFVCVLSTSESAPILLHVMAHEIIVHHKSVYLEMVTKIEICSMAPEIPSTSKMGPVSASS